MKRFFIRNVLFEFAETAPIFFAGYLWVVNDGHEWTQVFIVAAAGFVRSICCSIHREWEKAQTTAPATQPSEKP